MKFMSMIFLQKLLQMHMLELQYPESYQIKQEHWHSKKKKLHESRCEQLNALERENLQLISHAENGSSSYEAKPERKQLPLYGQA